ncbi:MAG TPA: hypothetical protein VGP87_11945 [Gemmatimonadales bacterium]|nr:hypothetical protein [Gemmatimonadales bacterium]
MTLRSLRCLASLLVMAAPLSAQDPDPHSAQPERPTVATHAGTVAPRWLELETGLEFDRSGGEHALQAPLLFKIGLARRLQLSVMLPFTSPVEGGTFGPADWSFGIKWRLLEDAPVLGDFAIFPALKFPTGASSLGRGTGTTDVSLLLISSHRLGPVAVDLNAGVTRRSGDGSLAPKTATLWTASFGGAASGRFGWVAEVYGLPGTNGPAGSENIVALLAGPTFAVRPWIVLDLGGIIPISGPQPYAIYSGLTWNIGKL